MSSSSWLLALVASAAGCNAAFGNQSTVLDTDLDGVPDVLDNCRTRPNPDQADTDGDGTGDACGCRIGIDTDGDGIDDGCDPCVGPGPTGADVGGDGIDDGCELCATANGRDIDHDHVDDGCDACPTGPNHDEDGDGIFDDCDGCPEISDPGQVRTFDADNLGDVCDPSTYFNYTLAFDAFDRDNTAYWPSLGGWSITGDELVVSAQAAASQPRLVSSVGTTPTNIVETRITRVDTTVASGIAVRSPTFSAECSTAGNSMALTVITQGGTLGSTAGGTVDLTRPVRLRMRTHLNFGGPAAYWVFSCEVIDDRGQVILGIQLQQSVANLPDGGAGTVEMVSAGGGSSFQYLWVVTPDKSSAI